MVDERSARNEIRDAVAGVVVQAEIIHQVVLLRSCRDTVPVPRQLPGTAHDFVGRVDEIAALDSLLATASGNSVWVVEGTAGVGKTTLAVWWAHRVRERFPDGTLFVNLKGYDREQPLHPSSVLISFLQALGVIEARIPVGLDAQVGMYRSLLAGRQMLVVLDNARSEEQVRPLLPGAAGCIALVTSRRTLTGLAVTDGARSLPLAPFSHTEAETVVRSVIGDNRVERESDAVADLVEICGRLPLALRIAASRVAARRHSGIADLVAEISHSRDRLDALSDLGDDYSAVRTVFDWSYARLPERSALLFRRLGLHPNREFCLQAAAAFGGIDPGSADRHLNALVDGNLIDKVEHQRYRIHDLLHLYAAHRVEVDEPPDHRIVALRDGLTWYAHTALAADRLVFPAHPQLAVDLDAPVVEAPLADRAQAWAWLNTEHHTLLAALRRAIAHDMDDLAMALAGSMRFLVFRPRALWPMRLEVESLGLRAARVRGDSDAEMTFLRRRADTYQMLGRWAESDADLRDSAACAAKCGDQLLLGRALCGLGRNRKLQHQFDEARDYYLQALPLVSGTGYVEAVVEANLSQISAGLGQHGDALAHAERELQLRRTEDDPAGEGYALHDVAVAQQGCGDDRAAIEFGERAIAVYRTAVATERYLADALQTVAFSYERLGSCASAARRLAEAAVILTELGDPQADGVRARSRLNVAS